MSPTVNMFNGITHSESDVVMTWESEKRTHKGKSLNSNQSIFT